MAAVIFLWGAPAAGKTSMARAVVAGCRNHGIFVPHLSSDGIRAAIAPGPYEPALRDVVYDGLQAMLESALDAGMSVLIDANYLDSARRTRVREAAAARGAPLLSVLVRCALASRQARNRPRPPLERVPEAWLESAHARAEALHDDADHVIDTDLVTSETAADRLVSWLVASLSSLSA